MNDRQSVLSLSFSIPTSAFLFILFILSIHVSYRLDFLSTYLLQRLDARLFLRLLAPETFAPVVAQEGGEQEGEDARA